MGEAPKGTRSAERTGREVGQITCLSLYHLQTSLHCPHCLKLARSQRSPGLLRQGLHGRPQGTG